MVTAFEKLKVWWERQKANRLLAQSDKCWARGVPRKVVAAMTGWYCARVGIPGKRSLKGHVCRS